MKRFKALLFNIKRFFQIHLLWPLHRSKHGWAENDVWNFDTHLSNVIIGGLRRLIAMGNSYPSGYDVFSNPIEAWHNTLKDIIAAFEEREKFDDYMWEEYEKLETKYNKKVSKEESLKYNQRMDREYAAILARMRKLMDVYDNLWD